MPVQGRIVSMAGIIAGGRAVSAIRSDLPDKLYLDLRDRGVAQFAPVDPALGVVARHLSDGVVRPTLR